MHPTDGCETTRVAIQSKNRGHSTSPRNGDEFLSPPLQKKRRTQDMLGHKISTRDEPMTTTANTAMPTIPMLTEESFFLVLAASFEAVETARVTFRSKRVLDLRRRADKLPPAIFQKALVTDVQTTRAINSVTRWTLHANTVAPQVIGAPNCASGV